jgi:two-component system OmpR family response regulator
MSYRVLVIEDQREIANLVKLHLHDIDCQVKLAFDGSAGPGDAEANHYDLIILDLMLPGENGLEICRRLRARADYTPILMLTSRASELDRVLGLEMGADDYLTKPFSVLELLARVKAIFRRIKAVAAGTMNRDVYGSCRRRIMRQSPLVPYPHCWSARG